MGRLIDADELLKEFDPNGERLDPILVRSRIVQQSTAYDEEKVVTEIQKKYCQRCRNILSVPGAEEYCKEQKCRIDEICDIVKAGGVE